MAGAALKRQNNKYINKNKKRNTLKKIVIGVPVVAQWLTNPTRNNEVAGSVPGLAQRVKDLALL